MHENNATFSVVVPTFNRLPQLRRTLESLFTQDYSHYDIIVVNDGGTDGTGEYIEELTRQGRIKGVTQSNAGLAAARKAGFQLSRGEYVAFTDDDCEVPPDWLSRLFSVFRKTNAAGVGGATLSGDQSNPYALANDIMHNHFKHHAARTPDATPFITGNNMAYSRDALLKVGGPDPRFRMGAEDRDLAFRIHAAGGAIVYEPSIVVRHFNDVDLVRYVKQQFRYGVGSYLFYSSTSSGSSRPRPASLGTYFTLLLAPFSYAGFVRAVYLSLLIIVGQVAVTAGFLKQSLTGR